uniref:Uncharacterized protein n=1 Tax=Rhizophora mucronata TaxID=61149 RepID=A0A2P2NDA8_RHIMU
MKLLLKLYLLLFFLYLIIPFDDRENNLQSKFWMIMDGKKLGLVFNGYVDQIVCIHFYPFH